MKRISIGIFLAGVFLGLGAFSRGASAESIVSFRSDIAVHSDASIEVTEAIRYDFEGASRHGIFRTVPISYRARGGAFVLRVSGIEVTDASGNPESFTTNFPGDDMVIRIGDPDRLVSGVKDYVIRYRVRRAINFFDDHDELYWNVTGNAWPVGIGSASATVSLPEGTRMNEVTDACYSGPEGGTDTSACREMIDVEKRMVSFDHSGALVVGSGLTVVVGFPKGAVVKPTWWQSTRYVLKDNPVIALPFAVLAALFVIWYRIGRDPKGRGIIIPEYVPPEDLTPSEVGTLIDATAGNRDVSADIISLAVRGYVRITRMEEKGIIFNSTDYSLEKLKSEEDLPNEFEKKLMRGLFRGNLPDISKIDVKNETGKLLARESLSMPFVRLSELKNVFFRDLKEIKSSVYESLVRKGYYRKNPAKVRALFWSLGGGMAIVAVSLLGDFPGSIALFSVAISGVLIAAFGFIMPACTKKGAETKEYIFGLKEYLSVAEKRRIEFHNAPKKNPKHFEALLPFAMVLGVESEWAKQFEGIYTEPPGWYRDSSGAGFHPALFVGSLGEFSSAADTNLSSSPGGGSGFSGGSSGGGMGGGGGGSW